MQELEALLDQQGRKLVEMDKIDDIDARISKDLKQLQMRIAQQRTEMAALITKAE